jgi:hypothetical protein
LASSSMVMPRSEFKDFSRLMVIRATPLSTL